ncbi:hypothetical protein FF38_05540, partial [Lucilia cuprina]
SLLSSTRTPIGRNPLLRNNASPTKEKFHVISSNSTSPLGSSTGTDLGDDEKSEILGTPILKTRFAHRVIENKPKASLKPSQLTPRKRVVINMDLVDVVDPSKRDIEVLKSEGFHAFKYEFNDKKNMTIHLEDIGRLNPNIYLNDALIWFFMKLSLEKCMTANKELSNDVCVLDTFFYSTVRSGIVPQWIKRLDILQKHVVFMPINENHHWSLAVIFGLNEVAFQVKQFGSSSVRPKLLILDSLGSASGRSFNRKVITVIKNVFEVHGLPSIPPKNFLTFRTDNPCQDNMTDCGVYLLHYTNVIMSQLKMFLDSIEEFEGTKLEMGEFWKPEEISEYRLKMKNQLKEMGNTYPQVD